MPNWQQVLFGEPVAPRAATRGGSAPPSALPPAEIQRLIEAEAVRQGVDPQIAVAIAKQESWLNPNAVGDNGIGIVSAAAGRGH